MEQDTKRIGYLMGIEIFSEDEPEGENYRNSFNEFGETFDLACLPRCKVELSRVNEPIYAFTLYRTIGYEAPSNVVESSHVSLPSLGHVTVKPPVDSTCQPAIEDPLLPFCLEIGIRLTSHRVRICVEFVFRYHPFRFIFTHAFDCSYVFSFIPSVHPSADTLSSRRIRSLLYPFTVKRARCPIYFPSAIFMHAPFFAEPPLFLFRLTFSPKGANSDSRGFPKKAPLRYYILIYG